jgi:hypothetical protein
MARQMDLSGVHGLVGGFSNHGLRATTQDLVAVCQELLSKGLSTEAA